VTDLDGEPPLDVLAGVAQSRSLVLALVERSAGVPEDARLRFAVRGIGGVDPRKKAIYVGDDVFVGDRLAFATPDAKAAREDFGAMLRDVTRHLSGGAPIAALYADCAGRGARLYKRHHVDARALGNHFPGLPFTCLRSSFEIGSHLGRPEVHTYTGVLGILYAPS
jgi:small ligand-binding sensory domain FIST